MDLPALKVHQNRNLRRVFRLGETMSLIARKKLSPDAHKLIEHKSWYSESICNMNSHDHQLIYARMRGFHGTIK